MARSHVRVHGQQKIKARRNKKRVLVSLLVFVLVSAGISGISFLSFLPSMTIRTVTVSSVFDSHEKIQSYAYEQLAKNRAWFFSGKNSFLYAGSALREGIAEAFPEVRDVSIKRSGLGALVISGVPRTPHALWCADVDTCVGLDESGFAFALSSRDDDSYVHFYTQGSTTPEAGFYITQSSDFKTTLFFVQELKTLGLSVHKVIYKNDSELHIVFSEGGTLIIDPRDDLSRIKVRIEALIEDRDIAFATPTFMKALDYIDMRYGSKLVYRMKDGTIR